MSATPLDADAADFLDDLDYRGHTRTVAVSVLNRWARWCVTHDTTVRAAGHRDLRAFLDARESAGVAPSTRRKDWQTITAFYAWAARPTRPAQRGDRPGGGILKADPMLSVRAPYVSSKPATRAAKADEVERLLDSFPSDEYGRRNAAMVSLMFRSGMRVGELPGLNLADLVDWGATGRQVLLVDGADTKTGEPRRIPVHPETQRLLARYLRRRGRLPGPLFMANGTADGDGRLTTSAVRQMVKRAAKRAGVPVTSHQFRRGFVSQYLKASRGDVLGLEVIGGWADHRMPRRYLADEEAQAGVDRYFDVFDGGRDDPPSRRRPRRSA